MAIFREPWLLLLDPALLEASIEDVGQSVDDAKRRSFAGGEGQPTHSSDRGLEGRMTAVVEENDAGDVVVED